MKNFALVCAALTTGANAFVAPHGIGNSKSMLHEPSTMKRMKFQPLHMKPNQKGNDDVISLKASTSKAIEGELEKNDVPSGTLGLMTVMPLIFSSVCYNLQLYLNTPCLNNQEVCTPEYHMFAEFFRDSNELLTQGLILTHAIPFFLIPLTIKFISDKGPMIKRDHPEFNPFILSLGMATIAFGLALEFGWHVADSWYYGNEFHILNYGFYFFLISGFALWADGFGNKVVMDILFFVILLASSVLYPIGNELQVNPDAIVKPDFLAGIAASGAETAKIPLYIGMTVTFASITKRGYDVFGNAMLWVAFLSVGVNLFFIFLLAGVSYVEGAPLDTLNYVYHICHDVLGTEAGVALFAYLIYNYEPKSSLPSGED